MNAVSAFENRKDMLLDQLRQAQSQEQAIAACVMALEQTACELAQDEQDETARQRQQAVMALARRMPQMLGAARAEGELVLQDELETAPEKRGSRMDVRRIMQIAGAFVLGALAVHEAIDGKALFAVLQLCGGALLALGSARKAQSQLHAGGYRARGVLALDADAMVRQIAQLCQAADVCVSDLMLIERDAGVARLSGTADEAMLDLLCVLMEAKASGRDDLAMRSLAQAEQYLHLLGVEVAFYGAGHDELFDLLPTLGEARTIRPALIKDGRVLRRGAAACRVEGGMRG